MDEFLQKSMESVPNMRGELLGMLERFDKRIMVFRKQYEELCQRQSQDLANRAGSSKGALNALARQQEQARRKLEQERDAVIQKLEDEVRSAQQKRIRLDQQTEESYHQWEKNYQNQLDAKNSEDYRRNRENDKFLNELRTVRDSVRNILGESRYDRIVQGTSAAPCRDDAQAQAVLRRYEQGNRTETEEEILRIHNSLLRRLLFSGKRNRLCCSLEQMILDVGQANDIIRRMQNARQADQAAKFNLKKQEKRKEADQAKQGASAAFAQVKSRCGQAVSMNQKKYGDKLAVLQKQQKDLYIQRAAYFSQEYKKAEENWKNEKREAQRKFQADMETAFPAVAVRETVNKSWSSTIQYSVKNFGALPPAGGEAARNVPVGEMYINVGRWYAGESGKVLMELLPRRYGVLFRKNAQNGKIIPDPGWIRLPFWLSLDQGESLLVLCPDSLQEIMESRLQGAAMRILWSVPVGQSQFLLGDSDKIGSFSGFASLDPALYNASGTTSYKSILDGNQVWSTANDIRQRISNNQMRYNDIAGQMGGVSSLREYNFSHPMNQRSYEITILQKFPDGLDEASIRSLRMMSSDCGKWGYSSILSGSQSNFKSMDPKLSKIFEELKKAQTLCLWMKDKNWFTVKQSAFPMERGCQVAFYPAPENKVLLEMKEKLREETEKASGNKIDFEHAKEICPSKERRYKDQADSGVIVPIGYLDGGEPCRIIFDYARVHTIINGDTGSGKTNLLHILITNILLRYPPEEVQMYLIDFKHGTEFRKYINYNLPSFKAISICNEPEFALQILQAVRREMEDRVNKFGNTITNIQSYNETAPKKMPRIILILDELYELVMEAKASKDVSNVREQVMRLMQGFSIQGRAYGIHMVISGQNLTEIPEIKTIKESCNTRIALRCSEQQVESLINKDAKDRMLNINERDKGACVVQLEKTGKPLIEHTAYLDPDYAHIRLLEEIHRHYCQKHQYGSTRVMTTDISTNPNHIYQRYLLARDDSQILPDCLWLGEKILIDASEGLHLRGKNLWIVGGVSQTGQKAGESVLFFGLLSLLLQQKRDKGIRIWFCSGETGNAHPVGNGERAAEMALVLKNQVLYATGDQMLQALQSVYGELSKRRAAESGPARSPAYFILERPEGRIAQNPKALQVLQEILLYGPSAGIQVLLWTREPQKLAQLHLPQLPFAEKLLLEMESGAYQSILGVKLMAEPKGWHAVTSEGVRMRIYNLPEKDWIESMILRLGS
ncbi:MAG TPA: hypothetical protein IAB31_03440 [Candidatus Choladousia intestinavium]|uniref:FtsK domain-containing protein n=1 Tax=Candidatus Choladousia intestinavium TaxID=2840727 RepID=A0A9D1D870_9FIRM|nr:hypothetical protein [Candidatus Choladousia intestinavium]